MTIAVLWQEDGFLWCAADTRLVAGENNQLITEMAAKIYTIPMSTSAAFGSALEDVRQAHYSTEYGFAFAGSASPASMTAVTAATLLQRLVRIGDRANPPRFEEVAELVAKLATRFARERRELGFDGLFDAAFFGWCPFEKRFKVARLECRSDSGSFRMDLSYPDAPETDGEPWLVLGGGAAAFKSAYSNYKPADNNFVSKRVARRVIDKMVADGPDPAIGGSTSIGFAHTQGFELCYTVEPVELGKPPARRVFNGLDLDTDVGSVGAYSIGAIGIA